MPETMQQPNLLTPRNYRVVRMIGKGCLGTLLLCEGQVGQKENVRPLAVKVCRKCDFTFPGLVEQANAEVQKIKTLKHPFIAEYYFAIQTRNNLYLGLEYCPGGDLFTYLDRNGPLSLSETRFILSQVSLALDYIHQKMILYRDLKAENIVFRSDGYVALVDFGTSQDMDEIIGECESSCGTLVYASPELLRREQISFQSDWWSFGILAYEMLEGEPPFFADDDQELCNMICQCDHEFNRLSDLSARDFINSLLCKDPDNRLGRNGFREVKDHPFFDGLDWEGVKKKKYLSFFKPTLSSTFDVKYFDADYTGSDLNEINETLQMESPEIEVFPEAQTDTIFSEYIYSEFDPLVFSDSNS